MMQPLLMRLKQIHPNCVIDVLAPEWVRPLLAHMPEVDGSIGNPFGHGQLRLIERWRFARRLAKRGYTHSIVLPNSLKSALIPFLAGIPTRTGFVGEMRYGLLNDARALYPKRYPLMVERFALLGEARDASLVGPVPRPRLHVDPTALEAVRTEFKLDRHRRTAVFCPGAEYGPAKRWPAAKFAELAHRLDSDGYDVYLLGSTKDRDIGAEISQASDGRCHNLCGATQLDQAIALLGCADVVITNDSGLMHVAAALNKPLVAIYGSSSPTFTPPLSETAQIVSLNLPCSPCFKRECPLGHLDCLRQLPVDQVYAALKTL